MEKVINEFRVIETDDGFRIEIKGDKEKIKAFMSGLGWHKRWPRWRTRRRGFFWGPFSFGCGPWDFEEDEETEQASKA